MVLSGDIVDSRGVDPLARDKEASIGHYAEMWRRLISVVHGEFELEWIYLLGNHDLDATWGHDSSGVLPTDNGTEAGTGVA